MKTKILQILYDLRHQPVISTVTFIGTALSIFLIMVVVIIQQIPTIPFAPESNRPRLLISNGLHLESRKNMGSMIAFLGPSTAMQLYGGLEGVEYASLFHEVIEKIDVKGPVGETFLVRGRRADGNFFKIFDHELVNGRYYTPAESDAMQKVAVVSESTAFRLFGGADPIGQKFEYDFEPYIVVGVVKDNSSLAAYGSGDVFVPTSVNDSYAYPFDIKQLGSCSVALLAAKGADCAEIKRQVKARYAQLNTELSSYDYEAVYHESPYDIDTLSSDKGDPSHTPDVARAKRIRLLILAILLLVPAINLSSMLNSRIRHRISEIGVQRAFGCTRARIITDIVSENFIVTLAGSVLGFALGVAFAMTYDGLYTTMDNIGSVEPPSLSMLLDWKIILIAFAVCFLLNLISAAVPAWRASRTDVVEAINAAK